MSRSAVDARDGSADGSAVEGRLKVATQSERRAATRASILASATALFAECGYDDVSIDDVALRAGVSKGGVYHHVANKEALFLEVFTEVQAGLASEVLDEAAGHAGARDQLVAGARAFLRGCTNRATARVLLLDGPRVLGWETWRALDERCFLALVRGVLDAVEPQRSNEVRAHLLLGALDEAALLIANHVEPSEAFAAVAPEVDDLITAVISAPRASPTR